MKNIKPFSIDIPETTLLDLKQRLNHLRWPDEIANSGWDYGANSDYLKSLMAYWKTDFNWRKQEARLNTFNHFIANIDGLDIHFIHARGKGPNPIPLILTHGWPSSFIEMTKIIPLLTEGEQSFDVIVPSLPGFGFSDRPHERGCDVQKISALWFKLMTEVLGYPKFCAHGADWGVSISARLGFMYPEQVMGIHTTTVTGGTPGQPYPGTTPASAAELQFLDRRAAWVKKEGAYAHAQSTTPQTLAYGLNDSPLGLAALLVEKFRSWSDCQDDIESRFSKDELLTLITLYWATETIGSSMRLYCEYKRNVWTMGPDEKIAVPCAVACFAQDNAPPIREWAERFYNIQRWTEFARGGHFPALEEPELLAEDIKTFFYSLKR